VFSCDWVLGASSATRKVVPVPSSMYLYAPAIGVVETVTIGYVAMVAFVTLESISLAKSCAGMSNETGQRARD
jgi:hypothetical protein